ncbi:MAG: hypothetical protein COS85_16200 [Armatimonadetes bacterium CG07_land_8_20_14_0_80_59_28]|nr:MAG: hypothetical protein COS85_16200 [Armatimonadetes bacterium CG07_land_8_20_14_0_80_59_28]
MILSQKRTIKRGVLLAVLAAFTFPIVDLTATPSTSADGSLTVGYVDLDALLEGYEKYQKVNKDFKAYQATGKQKILARRFLTWDEWKQLDSLEERIDKGEKLKDPDAKEYARLKNLSEGQETRLKELQGIREPSDDQKRERQELESLEKSNSSRLQQLGQDLARKGNETFSKLLAELQDNVRKAIAETAQAKSLKLVLDKKRLLWADATIEITEDILKLLNAH